ncbi:MAG: hypothetical protein FJ102_24630, partial [Deltaproteobacteria bacterium]|nr:hypothetical protein [Deltaproteobacteria bacterium]
DPNYPSPSRYMSDCIHPTSEGYGIIHRALVDAYWGATRPVAAISGPETLCLGEVGTWDDASASSSEGRWLLDGSDAGGDDSINVLGNVELTFTLARVAGNGAWEDETSLTVTVVDCSGPPSDTGDTAVTGDSDETGHSDEGGDSSTAEGDAELDAPAGDEGCGCQGGASGLWLLLAPLAVRHRPPRRATGG